MDLKASWGRLWKQIFKGVSIFYSTEISSQTNEFTCYLWYGIQFHPYNTDDTQISISKSVFTHKLQILQRIIYSIPWLQCLISISNLPYQSLNLTSWFPLLLLSPSSLKNTCAQSHLFFPLPVTTGHMAPIPTHHCGLLLAFDDSPFLYFKHHLPLRNLLYNFLFSSEQKPYPIA